MFLVPGHETEEPQIFRKESVSLSEKDDAFFVCQYWSLKERPSRVLHVPNDCTNRHIMWRKVVEKRYRNNQIKVKLSQSSSVL